MSSIVLMRILESAPDRYDTGMGALSLGAIPRAHARLAEAAVSQAGVRVLEIGCGTGSVTERLLERGARVEALDHSPEMLDRARRRLADSSDGSLILRDATAAEIDALEDSGFDSVVASLVLSEMSTSERRFVLAHAARVVRPGGIVAIADEVRPQRLWQRVLHALIKAPLALVTWVVTGTTTHAIADLAGELRDAGFVDVDEQRSRLGTLAVLTAVREV